MTPSTQRLIEPDSLIPNLEVGLKVPKLVEKPPKVQSNPLDDENTDPNAGLKVVSKSWRDKKRLYPPFRRRRRNAEFGGNDEQWEEVAEKSVPDLSGLRLSVCIRKNQFPTVCANIPLACDENTLEFGRSDLLYSSGCGGSNEMPKICGLQHAPCVRPICDQDNEPCNIILGVDRADDVCQDAVDTHSDKSDVVCVPGDKRESHCYMTVCGESIDYIICTGTEKATFTPFEDEVSREDLGGDDYFDIHDEEYDNRDENSDSENEQKSVLRSESELFQDPLVSHRLILPYKEMPSSRYHAGGYINDSSRTKFLEKRPRSPIRDPPEGRFDVNAGIVEVTKRAELHNAKYALRKSKEWMDKMITENSTSSPMSVTSAELLTTFLKVLLDDVRLSLMVGEDQNDVSLTLATVWAFTEFVMTKTGLEMTQSITIANLGFVPKSKRSLSHNLTLLKSFSFKETLDISYPPKGSNNHSLHQALPWVYLCAAHAEGLPKNYATVRDRIDEATPNDELKRPRAGCLPDISCAHLNEILRKNSCR